MMMDFSAGCSNCWNGCSFRIMSFLTPAAFHVVCGNFVCFRVVVVTVYLVGKFTFLAVVVVYRVEQLLVEIPPLLESKLLAEYARSDVAAIRAASMGIVP